VTRQDRVVYWIAGVAFLGALVLLGLQGPEPCLDPHNTACAVPYREEP